MLMQSSSAGDGCLTHYLTHHYGENDRRFLQGGSGSRSSLTVHRKHSEAATFGNVSTPPVDEGYLVSISLLGDHQQLIQRGRFTETRASAPDTLSIRDLSERHDAYLCSPFDFLFFHVPRAALDAVARENGARRVERLSCRPGTQDPIVTALGRALLPAFNEPTMVKALFVEHVILALGTHLAQNYGGLEVPAARQSGRLSRAQERRAKEFLMAHVAEVVSIADVAAECELSRSYFIKAFKQTTGRSPHKWLLDRRIEQAMELLLDGRTSIVDIAAECGFADQSHLTRAFASKVGVPPGAWRRQNGA